MQTEERRELIVRLRQGHDDSRAELLMREAADELENVESAIPADLADLIHQAQAHMLRTPEADAISVKLTQYLMNAGA